ncbi:MAG: hypothetical protein WC679_09140 [Bacteroidales bacterium]|jgi:hypothetical protein
MKHRFILTLLAVLFVNLVQGQVLIFLPTGFIAAYSMPEHGFLPGKKFKYYSTIDKYDFKGHKLRVELFDDRDSLRYDKIYCSDIDFTNTSEFVTRNYIEKVGTYIDTLFKQSGIIIDRTSTDTLQVRFEAFDVRLIGFGYIRVHGLCQMKMKYHNKIKTYCIDISDADEHSPISPNAFVTRKTGTRILASASIREIIEQFLIDFKSY